jgi:pilus assembly protein CpaE
VLHAVSCHLGLWRGSGFELLLAKARFGTENFGTVLMGNYEYPRLVKGAQDLRSCADVLVVASPKYISALSLTLSSDDFPGLTLLKSAPSEAIPEQPVQSASLVVVEIDPSDSGSLERLVQLQRANASKPIIAAIPDASVALVRTLVREGVADVISLPFAGDELLDAAVNVIASRSASASRDRKLAPLIAVAGRGATSVSTHLAAELGRQGSAKGTPILVDLDLQFGSVADVLSAEGRGSITDLLDAGEELDDMLVESVARKTEDGVAVIAAPAQIVPLESVEPDDLIRVLDEARLNYSHVVLDFPRNWTNWTLTAALAADAIVLLVELSIASLREAKRQLEMFQSVGVPKENILVVVNRFEKRLFRSIDLDDVAETLHHRVTASISLDEPTVASAQDQGRLVTAINRRSRFGTDIGNLAKLILTERLGERN